LARDDDVPHEPNDDYEDNEIDKTATAHDHTVARARAPHKCPFVTVTEMLQMVA
jgi:hypothetical protein